jgi:xanthine/uracil permease/putative methionine-R-sulfoxide reductase with GAF domain
MNFGGETGVSVPQEKAASPSSKLLRRLLKRRAVRDLLASPEFQDAVVTDLEGNVVAGEAELKQGSATGLTADGDLVGAVYAEKADQLAALLGAYVEVALENRALAAESLEKYRELSMLYSVSEKLLAAPDPNRVAELVCEEAYRFTRSDSISVLLFNEETGALELARSRGTPYHSRSSIEIGDDVLGAVVRSGNGEIVNNVENDARPVLAENRLHAMICSPLKSKEKVVGVVVVGSESPRHYNAADLQLLNALASQAAAAIDVARLYGDLKRRSAMPADLIYGLNDRPPPFTLALLGAQHVFIAFIVLVIPVLIAIEAGVARSDAAGLVSMSLIAMGIVTLLQVKRIGPVGAGYLAPQITSAIYLPPALLAAQAGGLALVFGMTFLSGIFGLVFSQIIGRLRKLFPPEVCGVVVLMIGISIIRFALPLFLGVEETGGDIDPAGFGIGLLTLATMIAFTVTGIGRLRLYATILGLLAGYAAAFVLGVTDDALVARLADLPWFGAPPAPSLALTFSPVLIAPFLIATLASNIKIVGLITSAQKANDAAWKRPDMRSIRGGIVADSLGNMSAGLLGGVPTSVSAGNIGLAAATGATSRLIGLVAGLMFIALAFVPKATAAIALMPAPVMGAGLLFTSCFLIISGIELIVSRLLDSRRTFIVGLSILAGIGVDLMPSTFADLPAWTAAFLGSPLAFATTLAVVLNMLLGLGVSRTAQLDLAGGATADDVFRFFDRWGATWGARPDVIRRAAPATVDLVEEIWSGDGGARPSIGIMFDEFRLVVEIRWRSPAEPEDQAGFDRLLGHLQRRYDCRARLQGEAERVMRLEFEH